MGGATTVSDAVLLVAPGPLSFELIGPVVLFCVPGAMPVTFTDNVHDPLAASVPPERLMMLVPAVAVIDPAQVPLKPLGVDTISPAGRVSLNEIPVNGVPFGFVMVKLALVLPFSAIVDAPNAFVIVGGAGRTTMVATLLMAPGGGSLSAKATAELVYVPALEPGGATVGACICTVAEVPGARFPKLQFKATPPTNGEMLHVPGPPYAGLMIQGNENPPGSSSSNCALIAVPVPAALLLLTVIVKPIVVPVATGVASAVLVTLRLGDWANVTSENNRVPNTDTLAR
jgi:hypothetical protein